MASSSHPQNYSLLLKMPAEIRNEIYNLAATNEHGNHSQDYFVLDHPLPALFLVNKQVRREALDVFLQKNHFHIYTSSIGLKWLQILGPDVSRFRRMSVFIDLNLDAWAQFLEVLLPSAPPLLELRIRKAAASLPRQQLNNMLIDAGLYDPGCWKSTRCPGDDDVVIFKKVCASSSDPFAPTTGF